MSNRYPDPNEVDESLFDRLLILPDGSHIDLVWVQKHIWPEATSFEIPRSLVIRGMQANMFTLTMNSTTCSNEKARHLIAKRIVPSELPPKDSSKQLKQFIQSVRKEIMFYETLKLPENQAILDLFPTVHFCSATPPSLDDTDPLNTSYLLILSDLSVDYYQAPAMNRQQALAVMRAFAKFHAHFWRNPEIDGIQRGGFWVLERRLVNGELDKAEETWDGILTRFPKLLEMNLEHIRQIPIELVKHAKALDHFVASRSNTFIHGDAKGWNLFLSKPEISREDKIVFIDMQWTGKGHPLQDVAYALTTSLSADLLKEMDSFVDFYVECLKKEIGDAAHSIDFKELRSEYDIVWLDYARVIVTGLWKSLDPERMKRYQTTIGPSMINRSLEHVEYIIRRIHCLMFEDAFMISKLNAL